uniref:Telomere repeat binding bouquet formation protein 2 n=1 Tax=Sphenodon punctatus TaxID=8508 RepID=A0A8D0GMY5_SPHPU
MFRGCSAWFSQSVSQELCDLWVSEGGMITNHYAADYLFSNDASHPDTQRIHQSLDYVEGKATIFHSCYLSASSSSETKETVALGHFLLPPASLQKERQSPKTPEREEPAYYLLQDYPVNNMVTGYVSAKEMKKFLGEIQDFIPGSSGYLAYRLQNETDFLCYEK